MIDRRHFAALAALVILLLAVAGVLVWRAWNADDQRSLSEPIAMNATLGPEQHLFGDPVRARVEVILDAKRIDPETVKLRVNFAPYRPLRSPSRVETTAGAITRLEFSYVLGCMTYRCLPYGQRDFSLHSATLEYRRRGSGGAQTLEVDWPSLEATGRISATRLWEARLRADYRELGAMSYTLPPRQVGVVALVLSILFGAAALILILRLLPLARIAERLGLKTVDTRTSLELALARVRDAAAAERPDEGRRALERLAQELRRVRSPELARAASRLAWSRTVPADGRLTALSTEVERLIAEGGRS